MNIVLNKKGSYTGLRNCLVGAPPSGLEPET